MKYKEWEDIYPLTVVSMRYGGKYVSFNCSEDMNVVQNVNTEEVSYELESWLSKHCLVEYGVGSSIMNSLNQLLEKINKSNA